MIETLDFDITVKEVPVTLRHQNGTVKEYVLREASGDASARYRSAQAACADLKDGSAVRIRDVGGLEPLLVSLCLFEVVKSGDVFQCFRQVEEKTVRSWPQRVQSSLYRKALEISELGETSDEDSKKLAEALQKWLDEHKGANTADAPTVEQVKEWLEAKNKEQLGNAPSNSTAGSS